MNVRMHTLGVMLAASVALAALGCRMATVSLEEPEGGARDAAVAETGAGCTFPLPRGTPVIAKCPKGCVEVQGIEADVDAGCTRAALVGCIACPEGCGGAPEGPCYRSDEGRVVRVPSYAMTNRPGWSSCSALEEAFSLAGRCAQ